MAIFGVIFSPVHYMYIIYIFRGSYPPPYFARCEIHFSFKSCVLLYWKLTAQHSSSGRQPNFAAWDKEGNCGTFAPRMRHLHSAGRPSRWASAHILLDFGIVPFLAFLFVLASVHGRPL